MITLNKFNYKLKMNKTIKEIIQYFLLFSLGGLIYYCIECMWKGSSHWSMYILGGICFLIMGFLNKVFTWKFPLLYQMLISGVSVTILEFIFGVIFNIVLKYNVWDYTGIPGNILGQVCPIFTILWILLSLVGIVLDDYIRYIVFNEDEPRYNLKLWW